MDDNYWADRKAEVGEDSFWNDNGEHRSVKASTRTMVKLMMDLLKRSVDDDVQAYVDLMDMGSLEAVFSALQNEKLRARVLSAAKRYCNYVNEWDTNMISTRDVVKVLYPMYGDGDKEVDSKTEKMLSRLASADKELLLFALKALALKTFAMFFVIAKTLQHNGAEDAREMMQELLQGYTKDIESMLSG